MRIIPALGAVILSILFPVWTGAEEREIPSLSSDYPVGLTREGVYQHANDYYLNGELEKALEGYQYLFAVGVRNGYLFYNLGNTYFRLGRLGSSILWYERALNHLPRFRDLRVNYDYARGLLADEEFRGPEYGGTLGFLLHVYSRLTIRETLLIATGLFWVLTVLLLIRLNCSGIAKHTWFSIPCWIAGIAFILFCLSSTLKIVHYETTVEAVVMDSVIDVKTGPGNEFSTSFTLHEGTKVRLIQTQQDWVRVLLPGNTSFTGWMPKSSVETI